MARSGSRSAGSGRFVSDGAARRSSAKTTTEAVGRGTSNDKTVFRSAESGQFVTAFEAKANPTTTIRQKI
jgi:hypothetical protein